ncbi:hypothetical protein [Thioflexithrix psekupsensis]|uniref:Uncharacterized protein n=1 Tax=Thioflexithrix psekupsensis TaxID=1570016 RepID=A0A251X6U9_9GAMM|nr:hypothetical protein [Thioflexithrix psekupsensis]OUD13060.1 hypothetical protein TPSD3_10430 [Thioflexithrix psekupsensis]
MPNTPAFLTRANTKEVRQEVRDFAQNAAWLDTVINDYPAPIAHEYYRLKTVLEEGLLVTAVLQLKDVVEVLIKFPAVVMAQWLLTHQDDETLKQKTWAILLGKKLSLGDWQRIADELAKELVRCEALEIASLAQWFRQLPNNSQVKAGRETTLQKLLKDLIQWRNETVGHGALRLHVEDYFPELKNHIIHLNDALKNLPTIWQTAQLYSFTSEILHGAACLQTRHADQDDHPHQDETLDLFWQLATGEKLLLSPLLALRRCTVCGKQDVFFFDGRDGKENKYKLAFLDYFAGHKMMRAGHYAPELAHALREIPPDLLPHDTEEIGGDFIKTALDKLLKEKSLDAEYLSPTYLRQPLAEFITQHSRGIFYLHAPAHVGKSLFVQGLAVEAGLDEPLLDNLLVVTFHLRREYRYHLNFFIDYLGQNFRNTVNVQAGSQPLPEFDRSAKNLPQAFVEWIGKWLAVYRQVYQLPHAKLLLCVDGLDEFTFVESPHIFDVLPLAALLGENCYVLLTSRPTNECAPKIRRYLSLLTARSENVSGFTVNMQKTTAYLQLLRAYFDERVPYTPNNAAVFAEVLARGKRRFLYVALLCDLLRDYGVTAAQLPSLPQGEALYDFYLKQMKMTLGADSKQWAFFQQVLLTLAAAELAAMEEDNLLASVRGVREEVWQGLPLSVLAEWLGDSPQSARVVFALSSLKAVLRVERRSVSAVHYRLGLKGLTTFLQSV